MKVVRFEAKKDGQAVMIDMLERALDRVKAGEVADLAIVAVIRDGDGPQFWHSYWGEGAYGALVCGVSALEFDLHYRRYAEVQT